MEDIIIIKQKVSREDIRRLAEKRFGDMVKAVVDISRHVMAIGGELHADEEALLLKDGSDQRDIWGINIYPDEPEEKWIQFDSMINIRPSQENRSRNVENAEIREKIIDIVKNLVE